MPSRVGNRIQHFLSNRFDFLVEVSNARFDFPQFHENLFIGGEFPPQDSPHHLSLQLAPP
jgi:hypothetical protein